MQLYKKILVTIDGSPADRAVLDHVSAVARQNQAQVFLLHVVHSHTVDQERALRESGQAAVDGYRDKLRAEGVEAFSLIRSGEPEEEILGEIEGNDYDLVALGTHGHTFLGDILFGSVSAVLKHKVRIPLLLIRSGE